MRKETQKRAAGAAPGVSASPTAGSAPTRSGGLPRPSEANPADAAAAREELLRKYPDPGYPVGSIVDERRMLTPEAFARLAHVIARVIKNPLRAEEVIEG